MLKTNIYGLSDNDYDTYIELLHFVYCYYSFNSNNHAKFEIDMTILTIRVKEMNESCVKNLDDLNDVIVYARLKE